jgi:hypothetical protein
LKEFDLYLDENGLEQVHVTNPTEFDPPLDITNQPLHITNPTEVDQPLDITNPTGFDQPLDIINEDVTTFDKEHHEGELVFLIKIV